MNDSGAGAIIDIGDEPAEFNASAYLTNQFNPFVKENTPPMITNVVIDTKESWGWSWGVWHCEHAWAEIDVSILDVAPYNLWIGVTDRGTYLFFSGTGGQYAQVHHAVIDLDYWEDVFAEYYVNVSAWDTANNIAYFEKEVAGFFGGVMNFLEDVWNGIVGVFSAAWEAVKAAMTWILDYIKGIIMGAINGFINWIQTMIKNAISGIVNAMIQSWKALGGANLNDLTSSLLLFPLVIGAALTSGKTLINNIKNALLAIKTVEAGISALMMAITGGGYAALKIVLQQAAKEVMTKGFITATIMASAATIGIGAIETFSDGFFSNTLGIIFKSFVGGTLIVSACMDVYSNLQKEKISPQEKRSYVAALVLTGLFIEVFGGDLLSSALTGLGVESPFAKGILAMTLDVGGLILVAFGLQKFFKSNPTEKAWNVFEEIWSGITTSAEDTITILGFIGAVVGATFNAASGNWQWWEVSP